MWSSASGTFHSFALDEPRPGSACPHSEIQSIELVKVQGQQFFLHLATESGKVTAAGIMLESDERLRDLERELTRRIKH